MTDSPRRKVWIQTLERRQLDQRRLTVEACGSIREIAHSLAGENRFTKQTRQRYSVAEHCVRGSWLLPSAFAGAFLLHELSEVYLPDLSGPFKSSVFVKVPVEGIDPASAGERFEMISWSALEKQHTTTMLKALGLESLEPLIYCGEVKRLDWAMLAAEKVALHDSEGPEAGDWLLPHPPAIDHDLAYVGFRAWAADQAEAEFLARFYELFGEGAGEVVKADVPEVAAS